VRFNLYTDEQEEKIFIRRKAKIWSRSGLITEAQLGIIHDWTDLKLRQTNVFFRILFFIFTFISIQAVFGLYTWLLGFRTEMAFAWSSLVFGATIYGVAEYLVRRKFFYRHGIEESLALESMGLICAGIVIFIDFWGAQHQLLVTTGALLASAIAFWLYLRFGFLYAAIISVAFLCIVPFQLSLPPVAERVLLVLVLVLIFLTSIRAESFETPDFKKDKNTKIQACLLVAIYLALNLRLQLLAADWFGSSGTPYNHYNGFPPSFYWATYILIFLIPALGLYHGLKNRKRCIINVSLIASILTLATNKNYLGLDHYAWDPAILGVTMIVAAIVIMRWLNNGDKEMRNGFTALNLLKPEDYGIGLADVGAAVIPGVVGAPQQQPQTDRPFDGGQSGGGGAARNY